MQVRVKLFAFFREGRFKEEGRELSDNTMVSQVIDDLGIKKEEVGVIMINSRHCRFDSLLQEADILAIFPVIGGG